MSTVTLDRILAKVRVDEAGCWLWTGYIAPTGYGTQYSDGAVRYAHRVAYVAAGGEIPEGLQLDHLCRVRHCVNPEHLEPVTNRENMLRGARAGALGAMYAAKTHCPRGHEYAGPNLYTTPNGRRNCKECRRDQRRAWEARKRAGAVA